MRPATDIQIRRPIAAAYTLALIAATGCRDEPLSVGTGVIGVDKSQLRSYAAAWTGYIEVQTFTSGSDHVELALDEAGSGTITFGAGDAPALPTDPENPFGATSLDDMIPESIGSFRLIEGFGFSLTHAVVEQERIRLRLDMLEHLDTMCRIQPVFEVPDANEESYSCIPFKYNTGSEPPSRSLDAVCEVSFREPPDYLDNVPHHEIPCRKFHTCDSCTCDEDGCRYWAPLEVMFDGALDDGGTELTGTLIRQAGDPGIEPSAAALHTLGRGVTVRLTREQPSE